MIETCRTSGTSFEISDEDRDFYNKLGIPAPTLCPEERLRRRLCFRNFRSLYQRTCDLSGKRIISLYEQDAPFPVYDNPLWWSDEWSAQSFSKEIDFSRPFFEQYHELSNQVPRYSIMNVNSENCNYSIVAADSINCYLVYGCVRNENCMYGHIVWDCEYCLDCLYTYRCQWCTNGIDLADCYNVHYSTECANCSDSYFLHDCRNCRDCFGCTNLRGKQYYFFNEYLGEQAYREKLATFFPLNRKTVADGYQWVEQQREKHAFYPPMFNVNTENVIGNHCYECENLEQCFDAKDCRDCKYCYTTFGNSNCYDMSFNGRGGTNYCYEGLTIAGCNEVMFAEQVFDSSRVLYSQYCYSGSDLFGCNGLRNAKHCILNKAYTEHEFETLKDKLISHMKETDEWGEFFPSKLSPFSYNESIAQEYLPLSKEEVLYRGLSWKDKTANTSDEPLSTMPSTAAEVDDSILEETFLCQKTERPYRIQKQELEIRKRLELPLPVCCPDARHEGRMKLRGERRLWNTTCAESGKKIVSATNPELVNEVLSDEVYLKRLY